MHPIPDDALDDRLGIVGMTGSGKTYGAGTAVERLLTRGDRVIISDPLRRPKGPARLISPRSQ